MSRVKRAWPALIAVPIALWLRARAWLTVAPISNERASTYWQQARELVARLAFDNPEAVRRPPVYPAFLAGHVALFRDPAAAVVLSQHVLGLAAVCLLMALAHAAWRRPAVTAAVGLLAAVDPFLIYYESHIESESLFLFLMVLTLTLLALSLAGGARRRRWFVAAGVCCGLAALCRPEFALFPVVAGAVIAWLERRWEEAALFCVPAVGLVAAWMAHNALVFGVFTLSLMGAITSLQTSGPWIDWSSPAHAAAKAAYRQALAQNGGTHMAAANQALVILMKRGQLHFVDAAKEMAGLGRETLLRHPLAYLWATRRNFSDFFRGLGGGDAPVASLYPAAARHAVLWWWVLALGGAAGLWAARKRRDATAALLVLSSVYVVCSNCLVEVGAVDRRSLELEPLLLLFAGLAVGEVLGALQRRKLTSPAARSAAANTGRAA